MLLQLKEIVREFRKTQGKKTDFDNQLITRILSAQHDHQLVDILSNNKPTSKDECYQQLTQALIDYFKQNILTLDLLTADYYTQIKLAHDYTNLLKTILSSDSEALTEINAVYRFTHSIMNNANAVPGNMDGEIKSLASTEISTVTRADQTLADKLVLLGGAQTPALYNSRLFACMLSELVRLAEANALHNSFYLNIIDVLCKKTDHHFAILYPNLVYKSIAATLKSVKNKNALATNPNFSTPLIQLCTRFCLPHQMILQAFSTGEMPIYTAYNDAVTALASKAQRPQVKPFNFGKSVSSVSIVAGSSSVSLSQPQVSINASKEEKEALVEKKYAVQNFIDAMQDGLKNYQQPVTSAKKESTISSFFTSLIYGESEDTNSAQFKQVVATKDEKALIETIEELASELEKDSVIPERMITHLGVNFFICAMSAFQNNSKNSLYSCIMTCLEKKPNAILHLLHQDEINDFLKYVGSFLSSRLRETNQLDNPAEYINRLRKIMNYYSFLSLDCILKDAADAELPRLFIARFMTPLVSAYSSGESYKSLIKMLFSVLPLARDIIYRESQHVKTLVKIPQAVYKLMDECDSIPDIDLSFTEIISNPSADKFITEKLLIIVSKAIHYSVMACADADPSLRRDKLSDFFKNIPDDKPAQLVLSQYSNYLMDQLEVSYELYNKGRTVDKWTETETKSFINLLQLLRSIIPDKVIEASMVIPENLLKSSVEVSSGSFVTTPTSTANPVLPALINHITSTSESNTNTKNNENSSINTNQTDVNGKFIEMFPLSKQVSKQ